MPLQNPYHLLLLKSIVQLKKKGHYMRELGDNDRKWLVEWQEKEEDGKIKQYKPIDLSSSTFGDKFCGPFSRKKGVFNDSAMTRICNYLEEGLTWSEFCRKYPLPKDVPEIKLIKPLNKLETQHLEIIEEFLFSELNSYSSFDEYWTDKKEGKTKNKREKIKNEVSNINDRIHLEAFEPLEIILKNPFRHPNNEDFRKGLYYKNEEWHEQINTNLREKGRCLIVGKPGNGKSAVALGVSYYYTLEYENAKAYYLSVERETDYKKWLRDIRALQNTNSLFIIDNCHLAISSVNYFVERAFDIDCDLLFVSRTFDPDLGGVSEINFIDVLKKNKVVLQQNEATINEIIKKRVSIDRHSFIGYIDNVSKKCEGDIHLLNFYIEAWENSENPTITLSSMKEDAILDNIYRRYFDEDEQQEILLKVAVLSALEVAYEESLLPLAFNKQIKKNAWIDLSIKTIANKQIRFVNIYHSTPALYMIKAAFQKGKLGGETIITYIVKIILEYLEKKPINFFEVFKGLKNNYAAMKNFEENAVHYFYDFQEKKIFEGVFRRLTIPIVFGTHNFFHAFAWNLQFGHSSRTNFNYIKPYEYRAKNPLADFFKILINFFGRWEVLTFFQNSNLLTVDNIFSLIWRETKFKKTDSKILTEIFISLDFSKIGANSQNLDLETLFDKLSWWYRNDCPKCEDCVRAIFEGYSINQINLCDLTRSMDHFSNIPKWYPPKYFQYLYEKINFSELGERSKDVKFYDIAVFTFFFIKLQGRQIDLWLFFKKIDLNYIVPLSTTEEISRFIKLCFNNKLSQKFLKLILSALGNAQYNKIMSNDEKTTPWPYVNPTPWLNSSMKKDIRRIRSAS